MPSRFFETIDSEFATLKKRGLPVSIVFEEPVGHGDPELFLRAEVVVDQAACDAGRVSQVTQAGGMEAAFRKDVLGRVEDLSASGRSSSPVPFAGRGAGDMSWWLARHNHNEQVNLVGRPVNLARYWSILNS